jgi:hypothetical protein
MHSLYCFLGEQYDTGLSCLSTICKQAISPRQMAAHGGILSQILHYPSSLIITLKSSTNDASQVLKRESNCFCGTIAASLR